MTHSIVHIAFNMLHSLFKRQFIVMYCSVTVCTNVQMKKDGSAVTEMMYRLNVAQKDEKQKQREAFRQVIFDKKQEFKQQQEALILKAMDEIAKREKVMQMKVITPLLCYVVCVFAVFMLRNSS